ncbi:MAG: DAK2 domain-containing protein, partial [Coriobacteriia bacterium]|nr:DAK2 domain-containing protein [Coriobacteriia bacterium]
MPEQPTFVRLVVAAAQALEDRKDEVNRLNVFPVPDGDTGTNMALTMKAVIGELESMPSGASVRDICHAITQGSLMGARGNSGVILSQILRGLCEAVAEATRFDTTLVAAALDRSRTVAFQAVRKPVEGTMLTVLKDTAGAAKAAHRAESDLDTMLDQLLAAAFESVRRTPELLPVLKENGVVDAGGFGLAILAEGLLAAYKGTTVHVSDTISTAAPTVTLEPANDWDDQEYLYCTEFLLMGQRLERAEIEEYVISMGGSELVVGEGDTLKIHVHTDNPGAVLAHMTGLGEIAEVHINNMRQQTLARGAELRAKATSDATTPRRPYGLVTVSVGDGLTDILRSLGADAVVNG